VLIDFTGNPLAQLNDIHGTESLMFVVGGEGQIAQRDQFTGDFSSGMGGFPLPPVTSEDLYSVFVLDDTHAWAVGNNGAILSFNGAIWSLQTSPTSAALHDVWAVASDDVWAVGDGGTVVHYDGLSWSTVSSGITRDLKSVWAADADHVWMAGAGGTVLFWEGTAIVSESSGTTADLGAVFGFGTTPWAMGTNAVLIQQN
jgi:photosystem II stability/assembly factor-like uncharacterized protein